MKHILIQRILAITGLLLLVTTNVSAQEKISLDDAIKTESHPEMVQHALDGELYE